MPQTTFRSFRKVFRFRKDSPEKHVSVVNNYADTGVSMAIGQWLRWHQRVSIVNEYADTVSA